MLTLGISAYYHDSAAALLQDGKLVAAAQEERFTRKKHDAAFPKNAVEYCLKEMGSSIADVDQIVFYDKPLLKFERLLETYLEHAPRGFQSFRSSMPVWLKEKLYLKKILLDEFAGLSDLSSDEIKSKLLFSEHHMSHAASAYYFSPFQEAAVLCLDGVGEWATTSAWLGESGSLKALWQIDFPHSLGMLYSAFTYFTGFRVNSGEYKLMGLAPYGEPKYVNQIKDELIDIKSDGTFRLNMDYFDYCTGLRMTNDKFADLFGRPARAAESELTQQDMDLAASIQVVTEEVVLKLARGVRAETGSSNLCLAGGVALNCVANGVLIREEIFDNVWIQPAAGDAGGAAGAAAIAYFDYGEVAKPPLPAGKKDYMQGSYLGPKFNDAEIEKALNDSNAVFKRLDDAQLYETLAKKLDDGAVVGWFQGRMEFGPRALGGRSIIGDPRNSKMQSVMNLKIKYRESFRPFAPSILEHRAKDFFDLDVESPYMLIVSPVAEPLRTEMTEEQEALFGIEKLNVPRSTVPAITHVDYSARVQTVSESTNPRFFDLLTAFEKESGCPMLVNTSFNVRGEPIVCLPEDAFRCFMRTEMDYLVIENYLLEKTDQTPSAEDEGWKDEFELD